MLTLNFESAFLFIKLILIKFEIEKYNLIIINLRRDTMGNYSSAYEEYYKNINNKSITKESSNKNPFLNNRASKILNNKTKHNGTENMDYFSTDYFIKRVEMKLFLSLALLISFMGLKYTGIKSVQEFYKWCKHNVVSEFNYDQSIEVINSIEIGTFKINEIKIGEFDIEDLKYENLKTGVKNFKSYLNQIQKKSI